MRILIVLSVLLVGVLGCVILNQPTFEVAPSRLTSEANPQLVDGNLDTVSTFAVQGHIEKSYQIVKGGSGADTEERKYVTQVEGSLRTEAVIKLDTPIYVAYVDIYPASRIQKLALTTTLEDPPQFDTSFQVIRNKQHVNINGEKPVRFQINRELLYLRLTADAIVDRHNSVRDKNDKDKHIYVPLKGCSIREVKFYGRM